MSKDVPFSLTTTSFTTLDFATPKVINPNPPPPELMEESDVIAVTRAIATVRSQPGRPLLSNGHVETQAVDLLVQWGHDRTWAEREVRAKLY